MQEHRAFRVRGSRLVGIVLCAAMHLFAQPGLGAHDGDPKNAATWYNRAIANWQEFKRNFPQQAELLSNYSGDPATPITPEIRAAIANAQGAINDFRKGSEQEYADFALDYSQGFEMLLPHLGEMRGISRAMRSDAAVRLADGDTAGAAALLSSMYKTSGHFGDDRVLISSLVGQAVFSFADAGVQSALDSAAFNAADAAALLNGVKQLGTDDPFQYIESQAMEQEIALVSIQKYRGAEGMAQLVSLLGGDLGDNAMAQEIGALDDAGFDAALNQYDEVMTRMNAAFSIADKDAAIAEAKKIEEAIGKGEFGPLAKALAPAHSKILERKFAGEQMIRDRLETLGKLVSGEAKPEEIANAAIWYMRAIEMWEHKPAEFRAMILESNPAHDAAIATAAFAELQPILDVVREASIKRRCDFAPLVRRRGPPQIAPHYAPGMHELIAALHSDARRLLTAGDQEEAIDHLAIALRVCGHLGNDVNLTVCRSAHVQFNATLDVIAAAAESKRLDLGQPLATALGDAAGRISRKDPFGYVNALQKTREDLVSHLNSHVVPADDQQLSAWGEQMKTIRGFNADQTMFALIICDERMQRMIRNPPALPEGATFEPDDITVPETISRMGTVFDAEAVDLIRAAFDEIEPRISANDWTFFVGRMAIPAARLTEGLTRVRADLRRATRLLLLTDDAEGDERKPEDE